MTIAVAAVVATASVAFGLAVDFELVTFANSCPPGNCDEYFWESGKAWPDPAFIQQLDGG
jgi:hypothetical protein